MLMDPGGTLQYAHVGPENIPMIIFIYSQLFVAIFPLLTMEWLSIILHSLQDQLGPWSASAVTLGTLYLVPQLEYVSKTPRGVEERLFVNVRSSLL